MPSEIELPDVFPKDEIKVEEEQHFFEVFQGDSGPLPKTEYTIDKAPIKEIEEITGTLNGSVNHVFGKGTDYELEPDNTDVIWLSGGDSPDAGTNFFITYRAESIISRYIGSAEEEFDTVEERIADAIQGKFVNQAEGRELDELGALFGQTIGKRRGRTDTQYRIYLQSVVQSFVSRGTKTGIKLAISAATDVPISDITIEEDFTKNQYEVVVVPDTPVKVSLLETIADIADPSGVNQVLTRFPVLEDVGINDFGGETSNSFSASDELFADDLSELRPKSADRLETIAVNDDTLSTRGAVSDTFVVDDTGVSGGRGATSDTLFAEDTSTIRFIKENALWEEQTKNEETSWGFFEWKEILDEVFTISGDTLGANDVLEIPAAISTSDVAYSNDSVTVVNATAETTDSALFNDAFSGTTENFVAWDLADWNQSGFNWAKESN